MLEVEEGGEEEEDWSGFLSSTTDFVQHELIFIRVSSTRSLQLQCVSSLSPLDMMDLSTGRHDATGQCVWMGALLFVEALARPTSDQLFPRCFRRRTVLELGCGTGVAGLALLEHAHEDWPCDILYFTDSDLAVLDLCRRNCERNINGDKRRSWCVAQLEWGVPPPPHNPTAFPWDRTIDTILATDVLYDVSSMVSLLSTVRDVLQIGGYFVMAHVPRASLPGQGKVATRDAMEGYILSQAHHYGLVLDSVIRPHDLSDDNGSFYGLNSVTLESMHEAGAAILIFQRSSDVT